MFPEKKVTIELKDDRATSLDRLKRNTKLTGKLASIYTDKEFIGHVDDCGFKIISSEIGRGAVCVFVGELQDSLGTVHIKMHTAFKVMFSILMLMPIVGFGIALVTQGFVDSIGIIILVILGVLFIRFVVIEFSFRLISKTGFSKLIKIIGINELSLRVN